MGTLIRDCPDQHEARSRYLPPGAILSSRRGSVLVVVVIAMTIAATLGTAIYSFFSTSTITQIGSLNDTKAYYLAESGGHYAIKRLIAIDSSDAAARNALMAELTASPFTVSGAGRFTLRSFTYSSTAGFAEYRFDAKGAPVDASVTRTISYSIRIPDQAGVSIPFDGTGNTLNTANWNTSGSVSLVDGGKKVSLNRGTSATQVSLDWSNLGSTQPNLRDIWNDANGLLSYEIQAKVKLSGDVANDVAAGISFRLNTQGDANPANDSFYGLSYLWCYNHLDLPSLCGSDSLKTFIVLWKQAANGARTVIGKQLAIDVSRSLVSSGRLRDWATLVVRVQEQVDPATQGRENLIYAFAGDPGTTPKGTIHWDYTKYAPVRWLSAFNGTDCSGGQKSYVVDSAFTTAGFDVSSRDEVGVHAIGGTTAELADLAMRFNFNGGQATVCAGVVFRRPSLLGAGGKDGPATVTFVRHDGGEDAWSASVTSSLPVVLSRGTFNRNRCGFDLVPVRWMGRI